MHRLIIRTTLPVFALAATVVGAAQPSGGELRSSRAGGAPGPRAERPQTGAESARAAYQELQDPARWRVIHVGKKSVATLSTAELAVEITALSRPSEVRVTQLSVPVTPGHYYRFSFRARADAPREFVTTVGTLVETGRREIARQRSKLEAEEKEYACVFLATEAGQDNGRTDLAIHVGGLPGKVWLSRFHLEQDDAAPTRLMEEVTRTLPPPYQPKGVRKAVWPVILVPTDQPPPTPVYINLLKTHLRVAQQRYRALLLDRDTFSLIPEPVVVKGTQSLAAYQKLVDDWKVVSLRAVLHDIFAQTDVPLPKDPFIAAFTIYGVACDSTAGAERRAAGGVGSKDWAFSCASENDMLTGRFQFVLQHELAHAFGLHHVETYGFSQRTSVSPTSYNPRLEPSGFGSAPDAPRFFRPELRILATKRRVFPNFTFTSDDDRRLPPDPPKPVPQTEAGRSSNGP